MTYDTVCNNCGCGSHYGDCQMCDHCTITTDNAYVVPISEFDQIVRERDALKELSDSLSFLEQQSEYGIIIVPGHIRIRSRDLRRTAISLHKETPK